MRWTVWMMDDDVLYFLASIFLILKSRWKVEARVASNHRKGIFHLLFFWICKSPNGHSCLWVEWTAFASVKVTYHLTYLVVVIGRFDGSVSLKAMSQGSTFSISASIFSSSASLIATTTCLKQCSFSLQAAADILQLQFFKLLVSVNHAKS